MLDLLGLIAGFLLIFVLRAKKVDYSICITLAALVVGLTSGNQVTFIFETLMDTLRNPETWALVLAVSLITVLGYTLKETGLMLRFVESLSKVLPGSILMAIVPALFGFLSMPGGALLSAPFIEPEGEKLGLKPEHMTYLNVWYRHLLYWINPITSSTIMATTLTGITMNEWLLIQSPLFFVMVGIGLVTSRGFITNHQPRRNGERITWDEGKGVLPLLLTVAFTLLGLQPWMALALGIISSFVLGKVNPRDAAQMFVKGIRVEIGLSILSMLYLREVIMQSGSVDTLFNVVIESGIPVIAMAIIIPLLIGAISGSPAMGVGISFPLLLPLFSDPNIHIASIIFVGIACTYIASPIHLCLVLTNSYYKSDINKAIRYLATSSLVLYLAGVGYHAVLNLL